MGTRLLTCTVPASTALPGVSTKVAPVVGAVTVIVSPDPEGAPPPLMVNCE
jgi:hypothetical protein